MDDLTLAEKFLAAVIAAGGVVMVWSNKVAKQAAISDRIVARVEATEKDIKVLKEAHDQRFIDIQNDIHALKTEVKTDLQAIWNRTEERHTRLDGKLDRLLERSK